MGRPLSDGAAALLAQAATLRPRRRAEEAQLIRDCLRAIHMSTRTLAGLWGFSESHLRRVVAGEADADSAMMQWLERKSAEWQADPPLNRHPKAVADG